MEYYVALKRNVPLVFSICTNVENIKWTKAAKDKYT